MRNSGVTLLTAALVAAFLFGLWELYQLRFEAGDVYPPYSSLRADPLGAKALFETVQQLPGMSATRNYRPVASLTKSAATVLFLGQDPIAFGRAGEEDLKELETLASSGARVVIAMRPVRRFVETKAPQKLPFPDPLKPAPVEQPPIQKRWGIQLDYITQSSQQAEEENHAEPKVTALFFRSEGKILHEVERRFGSGTILLVANAFPFSNEALADDRDAQFLSRMLAGHSLVIFDESHFGLTESGSVGTLVRKYRLQGAVAMLAVLLALFIWKNSSSFLPPRRELAAGDAGPDAKEAAAGLANLLRRNIPVKDLFPACWREWERSRFGGRHYSAAKIERAQAVIRANNNPVQTYRDVARILAEKI